MSSSAPAIDPARVSFERAADATLLVRVSGFWRLRRGLPAPTLVEKAIDAPPRSRQIAFDASALAAWDSSLVAFVAHAVDAARARAIAADLSGLPAGLRRLVELATTVAEHADAHAGAPPGRLVERVGRAALSFWDGGRDFLTFVGDAALALGRFVTGRARYRRSDLALIMQQCGADAFPVVTLIAFLVGVILAFMGAVQLARFGASIYVADLVGIAIARDMGAMMTAIIMTGRTGAAFAAELGTMKVTQEIDALTTMGISPTEFLVVPRIVALVVMMPLLCLYADFIGILGGAAVGVGMLDLSFTSYLRQTEHAVKLADVLGGLFKATVYGMIIAVAACLRGLQCGSSSSAVGDATTRAVVTGIVYIVVACGIFAFVFNVLKL
jgi:phospholipid/cholesterol/gamma-HCH transport system permease protein